MEKYGVRSFLVSFLFVSCFDFSSEAPGVTSTMDALMYLQKFGYVNPSKGPLASMVDLSSAIKEFQRFTGLSETGQLDKATLEKMNSPRCGVPDKAGNIGSTRKKRYVFTGGKWPVNELTYRITKYPRTVQEVYNLKDYWTRRRQVDREIERAFQLWSKAANLKFVRSENDPIDIEIRFEEGEHGDGDPFDGPLKGEGNVLAHAFFPDLPDIRLAGDAHFDDTEKWTINSADGINLLQAATHEFGHSLGLDHSDVETAVMAPYYKRFKPNFRLDPDDIQGIQFIYGVSRPSVRIKD